MVVIVKTTTMTIMHMFCHVILMNYLTLTGSSDLLIFVQD